MDRDILCSVPAHLYMIHQIEVQHELLHTTWSYLCEAHGSVVTATLSPARLHT